jgi:phytoene dehydrogenase-like protein
MAPTHDAIVVGSGPNGLAAAVALARAGRSVLVVEGAETVGGGARSAELTLPGYLHDVCSAVHPLVAGSPFLSRLPLAGHGLELLHPGVALAHPLDDGTAVVLDRSIEATSASIGGADGTAYAALMRPLARDAGRLLPALLGPLRPPRHPVPFARFALSAMRSAAGLARARFREPRARALFGGCAAHSMLRLDQPISASFGLVLALLAHSVGWPIARGGSQSIPDALAALLRSLGGEIRTSTPVESVDDLPAARALLLDLTPRQVLRVAGSRLPDSYRRALGRYRYGPGVFKLDWALDGPIPWTAPECRRAGTVHVGGTLEEIVASEQAVAEGRESARPFVLMAQPTLTDPGRAPDGKHVAWGYCHVPPGSEADMTERIEAQVERFAPGFRDLVIGRSAMGPADVERHNPNYVGGDINGGAQDLVQLFARPVPRWSPYVTPADGLYICSSSTPPGGGVHGMCGYHAARAALRRSL